MSMRRSHDLDAVNVKQELELVKLGHERKGHLELNGMKLGICRYVMALKTRAFILFFLNFTLFKVYFCYIPISYSKFNQP